MVVVEGAKYVEREVSYWEAERESISATNMLRVAMAEGAHAVVGMVEKCMGRGVVARITGVYGIQKASKVADGAHVYTYLYSRYCYPGI